MFTIRSLVAARTFLLALIVLAIFCVSAGPAYGASPPSIYGYVTNPDTGLPVEGATVAVAWLSGTWHVVEQQTDATGYYAFYALGAESYWVDAKKDGYYRHYMPEYSYNGINPVLVNVPLKPIPLVERLWGSNRFSTAVDAATVYFDDVYNPGTWWEYEHVVIASGDDRAAADPLAASGLCWAYDAPLFLVSATRTPDEVKRAVKAIAQRAPWPVQIHIVGGPVSVPDARYQDLVDYIGSPGEITKDRILNKGSRYDLAVAIAHRMKAVDGGTSPDVVLVANGADSEKFFDALALSPIAAAKGYPILLTGATSVPAATESAVKGFSPSRLVIGGGPNTVMPAAVSRLKSISGVTPEQWFGRSRYDTAIKIADNALAESWLFGSYVGVAARLPDALTGGAAVGMWDGPLLLTSGTGLTPATESWLKAHAAGIDQCFVFGGPNSISEGVKTQIANALK